ncbi:helix-turn-helix domain-containing protein [Actinoplanes sp. NPDC020271]|uniref:helix-turn-helix domain-containing protein n=1 Tax=Actinoplanes sp. NPDC020271 TaxID=3363896 RepID=UPI0037A2E569
MSPPTVGEARDQLRRQVVQLYHPEPGAGPPLSLRKIAAKLDRSYGLVWALLNEAGVKRRTSTHHKRRATTNS